MRTLSLFIPVVFLFFLCASDVYAAGQYDPLTDGLVGWWKMDEASWTNDCSTTTVFDSSGNESNGTSCPASTGPTGGSSGKFGKAGDFDGSDDRVVINHGELLDFESANEDFSIFLWVQRSTFTTIDVMIASIDGGGDGYNFRIIGTSDLVNFEMDTAVNMTSTSTILDSNWHHIGVTIDRDGYAQIYIDGVPDGAAVAVNSEVMNISNTDLAIGNGRTTSTTDPFSGTIDETRIYNRALSPAEVRDLYNWSAPPVGYWNMDENTGVPADTDEVKDRSGNANHGEMETSMTESDWVPGKFGSTLDFDGIDDYVRASMPVTQFPFTLSGWIKAPTDIGGSETFFGIGDQTATDEFFRIKTQSGGSRGVIIASRESGLSEVNDTASSSQINDNQWHYITGVFDSATSRQLYIDGILENTGTSSVAFSAGIDAISIGRNESSNNNNPFNGLVDDVRLYDYARTPGQIIEDMNGGHPVGGSPVGSQVGYWKFDEGYGDTAYDSSPQGNNGDLAGSGSCPTASYCPDWSTAGKFGNSLYFDGTQTADGDSHVRLPNDIYDTLTEGSISFWFNPDDAGDAAQVMFSAAEDDNGALSDALHVSYEVTGNTVTLYIPNNGSDALDATSTTGVTASTWNHVVVTVDPSGNKMYLNGKETPMTYTAGSAATALWFDDIAENTTAYTLGCTDADGSDTNDCDDTLLYQGYLDEVKIYSTALTPEQVKIDYNQGKTAVLGSKSTAADGTTADFSQAREFCVPGDASTCNAPVGWWKMDENTGTTSTFDSSGNENTLTLNAMEGDEWNTGKYGSSLKLDGTEYLSRADDADFDFGASQDFTVEVWVNSTQTAAAGTYPRILNKVTLETTSGYYMMLHNDIDVFWEFGTFVAPSTYCDGASSGDVADGNWHHLVGVRSGNSVLIYEDGVLTTTTNCGSSANISNSLALNLGREDSGSAGFFDGLVDDVRIYRYARTQAQIAWDFNRGGPIGWWKLDECSGTTAYDSSKNGNGDSNGNTGTITIGATGGNTTAGTCDSGTSTEAWNNGTTGKRNASLDFDGTDDVVTVPHSAENDITGDMTASFWVNLDVAGDRDILLSKEDNSPDETPYHIEIINSGTPYWRWYHHQASGDFSSILDFTGQAVSTGQWQLITFTRDTSVKNVKLYIDGILAETKTYSTDLPASGNMDLHIGGDTLDRVGRLLDGKMDDVRIFNYALTEKQVQTEYNAGAVSFQP